MAKPPYDWRYYLSGPMSGMPDNNFPAFTDACDHLRAGGLTIVSPHEKPGEGTPGKPYEQYLREDVQLMAAGCDALILMPGWTNSKGAVLELTLALALRMPIYFWIPDGRDILNMATGEWE